MFSRHASLFQTHAHPKRIIYREFFVFVKNWFILPNNESFRTACFLLWYKSVSNSETYFHLLTGMLLESLSVGISFTLMFTFLNYSKQYQIGRNWYHITVLKWLFFWNLPLGQDLLLWMLSEYCLFIRYTGHSLR